ncbi:MAG: T9SS type A sorting domain-containing protein [Candidatus Marinimicrobia bacterium]|nr:T9SS type A sorting domain-containing protein [Candidatus Neomarinimicrobiota bacterium]
MNGNTNVGGLVGSAVGGSTINDSYSTSAVVGSSNAGGLVGYAAEEESTMPGEESMPGATVTASFWDTETSGMTESSAGTGKSTVEMKSSGTFTDAGWDFKGESVNGSENIWNIGNDRNDGYPYLNFQHPTDTPLPVTLAFFSAELEQGAVNVTWVTESETENAYFLLYRNGKTVVKIPGAGTTSEPQSYAWTDQYVIPGRTYTYILADVDLQGKETKHHEVEVEAKVEAENGVDIDHTIGSAYPNPFNPVTMVPLNLAKEANVYAQLYDMLGRPVRELHNGTLSAGSYDLKIDGAKLGTGIYFVHVRVKDVTHVQKIALMK